MLLPTSSPLCLLLPHLILAPLDLTDFVPIISHGRLRPGPL